MHVDTLMSVSQPQLGRVICFETVSDSYHVLRILVHLFTHIQVKIENRLPICTYLHKCSLVIDNECML